MCSSAEAEQHLPSSAKKPRKVLKAFFELAQDASKDDRAIGVALYVCKHAGPHGTVGITFRLKVVPKGGTPRILGDGKNHCKLSAKGLSDITPEQLKTWMADDQLLYPAQE